jgi:hypothetical protein
MLMIDPAIADNTLGISIKKLLVIELDGVFLHKEEAPSFKYLPRGWFWEFFENAFSHFDIGIWCAKDQKATLDLVSTTFDPRFIKKFKFIKSAWHAGEENTVFIGLSRKIHFKPLSYIWADHPGYNKSNTVLIDSHAFHSWTNPAHTTLCIPRVSPCFNDDMFLRDYLWPCLLMLATSCDTQLFLFTSEPKWVRLASWKDLKDNREVYQVLADHHQMRRGKKQVRAQKFSSLEWSNYEMGPEYKQRVRTIIWKLKRFNIDTMKKQKIIDFVFALGGQYDRTYEKDHHGFLKECLRIHDQTSRFRGIYPPNLCKAFPGDKLSGISCFNQLCKKNHNIVMY